MELSTYVVRLLAAVLSPEVGIVCVLLGVAVFEPPKG
jgi:hypothetical protein